MFRNTEGKKKMQGFQMANLLNDLVVGEGNSLLVQLSVTSLADQLSDTLQIRVPEQIIIVSSGKLNKRQDS
jgi:hypothetical protein